MLILITSFTIKTQNKQNIIFNIISTMKIYTPMYSKNQINPELNRSLLSCQVSSGAATTFHQPAWCTSRFEYFCIFPSKLAIRETGKHSIPAFKELVPDSVPEEIH